MQAVAAYDIAAQRFVLLKKLVQQSLGVGGGRDIPLDWPGGSWLRQDHIKDAPQRTIINMVRGIPGRLIGKGDSVSIHFEGMLKEMNKVALQMMGLVGSLYAAQDIVSSELSTDVSN